MREGTRPAVDVRAKGSEPAKEQGARVAAFGPELAHGYFDAVSPKINDLLTFEELDEFLRALGFFAIECTLRNRNHHITARKKPAV